MIKTLFIVTMVIASIPAHAYKSLLSAYDLFTAEAHYVYGKAELNNLVSKEVFLEAYQAYKKAPKKRKVLVAIDYTKPSTEKRLTVIDMNNHQVLFHTHVAHGKNSGSLIAEKFSNIVHSKQTSLGTFIAAETYYGKHGYSLRIDGIEEGINHNARRRYIVVHGANYVNQSFIDKWGLAGTSWGCPAVPTHLSRKIINAIKGGGVIFAYGNNQT